MNKICVRAFALVACLCLTAAGIPDPVWAQSECMGENCQTAPDDAVVECKGEDCPLPDQEAPVETCTGQDCNLAPADQN